MKNYCLEKVIENLSDWNKVSFSEHTSTTQMTTFIKLLQTNTNILLILACLLNEFNYYVHRTAVFYKLYVPLTAVYYRLYSRDSCLLQNILTWQLFTTKYIHLTAVYYRLYSRDSCSLQNIFTWQLFITDWFTWQLFITDRSSPDRCN